MQVAAEAYLALGDSRANELVERGLAQASGQGNHMARLGWLQAMGLVGISVVIGVAGAIAATRLLNSLLFGVTASDPTTFAVLVIVVSLVAFLAAWLPARRATRVDPIIALRAE